MPTNDLFARMTPQQKQDLINSSSGLMVQQPQMQDMEAQLAALRAPREAHSFLGGALPGLAAGVGGFAQNNLRNKMQGEYGMNTGANLDMLAQQAGSFGGGGSPSAQNAGAQSAGSFIGGGSPSIQNVDPTVAALQGKPAPSAYDSLMATSAGLRGGANEEAGRTSFPMGMPGGQYVAPAHAAPRRPDTIASAQSSLDSTLDPLIRHLTARSLPEMNFTGGRDAYSPPAGPALPALDMTGPRDAYPPSIPMMDLTVGHDAYGSPALPVSKKGKKQAGFTASNDPSDFLSAALAGKS